MRAPARLERRECGRQPAGECAWLSFARLRHGPELLVVNLAEGGALVEAAARLLPGSNVELHLAAPGWRWLAAARVLRCRVSALVPEQGVRYRAALQFERPLHPPRDGCDDDAMAEGVQSAERLEVGAVASAGSSYPWPQLPLTIREVATRFVRTPRSALAGKRSKRG